MEQNLRDGQLAGGGGRPTPLATGLTWGSGDACDHRHSLILHETCEKKERTDKYGSIGGLCRPMPSFSISVAISFQSL